MSIASVTEIIAASPNGFDEAIESGIARANKTLHNVQGAWVESQKVECDDNGKIREYRVALKVTFVLDD